MEKLKIPYPIVVEGKYDKIKLASLLEAQILPTDGFGIFRREEQAALFRRLAAAAGGLIVLTDSDGAGRLIRAHLHSILPAGAVIDLYIPDIPGRERRKAAPSAAGLLGVEGMEAELLRRLFAPYAGESRPPAAGDMTRYDFYASGLSGRPDAAARRAALCAWLGLPREMSAGGLLAAVNLLLSRAQFEEHCAAIGADGKEETDGR